MAPSSKPTATTYCGGCGNKLSNKEKFCGHCGRLTETNDRYATTETIGREIFCPDCGYKTSELVLKCPSCDLRFWKSQEALDAYTAKLSANRSDSNIQPSNEAGQKKPKTEPVLVTFDQKPTLVLVGVLALGAFLYFLNGGYLSSFIDIYPLHPTGEKNISLRCDYAGKNITTNVTLYKNVNNYYHHKTSTKAGYLASEQYEKFIYANRNDSTISQLAANIKDISASNKLSNDQALELATCMIQNIPYDSSYGAEVLATGNDPEKEQYPYETLFNERGICTSKTYLGSALVSALGYGTGIILLPQAEHMGLGIQVPSGYDSFNSKYAYVEMTDTGYAPGYIPDGIDPKTGIPIGAINNITQLKPEDSPDSILEGKPKTIHSALSVINVNSGSSYTRIVATRELENSILKLIDSLSAKKVNLKVAYNSVSYWDNLQSQAYSDYLITPSTKEECTYYSYLGLRCYDVTNPARTLKYNTYTSYYNSYNSSFNRYNVLVRDYNNTLDTVNNKIDLYQTYQYN